jgi:hypothetical protein
MVRKFSEEDIAFSTFDEPAADQPAIIAALKDAEAKELYEFGVLTKRFFTIYQNAMMNTSINRTSFVATRANISKILGKMGREIPKVVYEVDKFA